MYECGVSVVADTTSVKGEGCVPQFLRAYTGHANIDSHRFHVETVLRDLMTVAAEKLVAPW